jgi:ribonuclease P protein component
MLKKENRFQGNNGLLFVYRRGVTFRSKYFAAKVVHKNRHDTFRVAVVVSKKVSKSAPIRNRIRRRLYELFRNYQDKLTNQDIVVTVFDEKVADIPHEELDNAVRRIVEEFTRKD